MPRLNIYIPDDLAEELKRLPGEINLSRVCASALRDAVAAGSTLRAGGHLLPALASTFTMTDRRLTHRYRIRDIVTGSHLGDYGDPVTISRMRYRCVRRR